MSNSLVKIKLCGFKNQESLLAAIHGGVDFVGFVFCKKSVRYITPEDSAKISQIVPSSVKKVAVLSGNNFQDIAEIYQNLKPDYLQFHGNESVEFIEKVKEKFPNIKVIKAFNLSDERDLNQVKEFENCADFFLFDSKSKVSDGVSGGTGESFNWEILSNFKCNKDWFLSGGLNVENILQAIKISTAKMLDISSGIEETRGEKSINLINELLDKIKKHTF